MSTFRISQAEYQATVNKVARINARAIKRGFTGRLEVVAAPVEVKTKDLYGMRRTEVYFDTEITGDAPKYGGWEFLATLDWDTADDLVVRAAPGVEGINRTLLTRDQCDHCGTHRQRKNIYLVRNVETGLQVQVGSSCLKDFLGHDTNVVFYSEDDIIGDLGSGATACSPDTFSTEYVLAIAWALIKLNGYKPASSFGSTTKGDVLDVLMPPRNMPMDRRAELNRIRDLAEEAMDRAQECLAWVRSDDFSGDSDYVTNLKVIAASEHIGLGGVGLLASAPQTWARWQEKTLIRATEASKPSNWVGTVGDKMTFTATIGSIRNIPGDFGTKTLYTMRTDDGNIIKWFCSGRNDLGDQVGRRVTVKATVKAHDTFREIKETLVTRAKEVKA